MGLLDELKARAARAGRLARTAFAAACAGRVLPVYEEYWVGDYFPEVARSVEIAWGYACGGTVDAAELQSCLDSVQDLVTYYYEDRTRNEVLATAVTVVLRALQSITDDEEASCLATARAATTVVDAAVNAEVMANWNTPREQRVKAARHEEQAWRDSALTLTDGWTGPARRDLFAPLGGSPPRWLLDWRERSER